MGIRHSLEEVLGGTAACSRAALPGCLQQPGVQRPPALTQRHGVLY